MNRPNQDMQQKRMNQKELYEWIMMLGFCAGHDALSGYAPG